MWALVAFEALSGIKINFAKTDLVPMNIAQEEAKQLAVVIGCKVTSFPIKYLGVPLHDKKLRRNDWGLILDKIASKIKNWKGSLLSIGGRLIIINAVLTAVLLYMLSLYKLPVFNKEDN